MFITYKSDASIKLSFIQITGNFYTFAIDEWADKYIINIIPRLNMYYPYLMYGTNNGTVFQLLMVCNSTNIGFGVNQLVPDTTTSLWLAFYIFKN